VLTDSASTVRVHGERVAGDVAGPGQDVEHAVGQVGLGGQFGEQQR